MLKIIVIGYVVIGLIVMAAQEYLPDIFPPHCDGIAKYPLIDTCDSAVVPENNCNRGWTLVTSIAMWLPRLFTSVATGEMTFKSYILGGYQCVSGKPPKIPPMFKLPHNPDNCSPFQLQTTLHGKVSDGKGSVWSVEQLIVQTSNVESGTLIRMVKEADEACFNEDAPFLEDNEYDALT